MIYSPADFLLSSSDLAGVFCAVLVATYIHKFDIELLILKVERDYLPLSGKLFKLQIALTLVLVVWFATDCLIDCLFALLVAASFQ